MAGLQTPAVWHWSLGGQVFAGPATQEPAWHLSLVEQRLPLEQAVPSGFRWYVHCPVAALQVPASWHWLLAVQTTGVPAAHVPEASQTSSPLQAFSSAQLVPAATGVCVTPATGSHASVVQGLPSSVVGGVPGVHVPAWHVSEPLHTVASLHAVPLGLGGFEQTPVDGLHVPAS